MTTPDIFSAIGAIAPVVTAIIALGTAATAAVALKNWRRQDKAKREAEFLDALVDAVHAYVAAIAEPIILLEFAKIGMESHASFGKGEQVDNAVDGAISFIRKDGEHQARRLFEALKSVRPSVVHVKALAAKGQIFSFAGYARCQEAITMLAWQLDRIEAFAGVIGSTSLNWEHPKVLSNLKAMIALDPEDIRKGLADNNILVLAFGRETYKRIYG